MLTYISTFIADCMAIIIARIGTMINLLLPLPFMYACYTFYTEVTVENLFYLLASIILVKIGRFFGVLLIVLGAGLSSENINHE
jgi:hypothetical protein